METEIQLAKENKWEFLKYEWFWLVILFIFVVVYIYNPLDWGNDLIITWLLLSLIGWEIAKQR